jgi:hypothetical protein
MLYESKGLYISVITKSYESSYWGERIESCVWGCSNSIIRTWINFECWGEKNHHSRVDLYRVRKSNSQRFGMEYLKRKMLSLVLI